MSEDGLRYGRLVQGEPPPCSRCGSEDTLIRAPGGLLTDVFSIDASGKPVCRKCITDAEDIAQGKRIHARLEAEADEIRKAWLGDDYDRVTTGPRLTDRQRKRLFKKRGPAPAELAALIDRIGEIEEIIDSMKYVAEANAELMHHAVTGEWPEPDA